MIIIGSVAIKYWFHDFNRIPKDLDVILYEGETIDEKYVSQYDKIEILENPILIKYCKSDLNQINIHLNPNTLLTLKMSHLFWDINWEKHMFDVQFLLEKGCEINEQLFYKLYEFWNIYHSKNKRSDLKMSAEDFFNNSIKFPIEHDRLHEILVQHEFFNNKVPTYKSILKDDYEVEVCQNKFNNLNHDEKCNLVYEEVMIMAMERFSELNYRNAYSKMLKKFIISHAPIWEAIFIITNFKQLHNSPINFIKFFNNNINK